MASIQQGGAQAAMIDSDHAVVTARRTFLARTCGTDSNCGPRGHRGVRCARCGQLPAPGANSSEHPVTGRSMVGCGNRGLSLAVLAVLAGGRLAPFCCGGAAAGSEGCLAVLQSVALVTRSRRARNRSPHGADVHARSTHASRARRHPLSWLLLAGVNSERWKQQARAALEEARRALE
jgi:hypothetical protein